MSFSGKHSSRESSGNLAEDELSESQPGSAEALQDYHGARHTEDSAFGCAGSPMPRVLEEFMKVEDRFRLQREGPRNSSDNLLLVYHNLDNPLRAHSSSPSLSSDLRLDPASSIKAQLGFRRFAKLAAESCAWLSRTGNSVEDVQAAYLSIMQSLDGLREKLLELPFEDKDWIGNSSAPRLPSLLEKSEECGVDAAADITLCAAEDGCLGPSDTPANGHKVYTLPLTTPNVHRDLHTPRLDLSPPLFPIHPYVLSPDSMELVVPTSDPREIEYPFMIVPSLESRLSRCF
ncbi:uncharacterized protein TRAVEDRAFT_43081 [Trametes versicolor FP-101664 SS1]|uniref:uncharacterized protein n=1 Tax=Trametes versicolor (strain FP-101664) TaxID=717944 RepID=UPI0004624157|nr:uncharacterized protein TRAVEDRAFT_43081 [Trametes versicolor FP-101664 SS1]EIW62749.1 hypothetical protein TRAVEDRAFT_43081 [Trametes versicolor FP-101664 SS1]